jgi:hypothetical protein
MFNADVRFKAAQTHHAKRLACESRAGRHCHGHDLSMTRAPRIMDIRRVLSRPAIFSFANRAEDIETLNAILARLRQQFHTKPSLEIYERVNAAYQAGTPVPTLFTVVVRDIQNQPPESDSRPKTPRRVRSNPELKRPCVLLKSPK